MGAAIRGPDGLIDLGAEPFTIGRSRNNRLVLTNSQISAKHAEVQPLPGGRYQVVDLGSSNGTAVRRDGAWRAIKQDFVTADEEIRFGQKEQKE